jgi:serine/threonine-protein kinase RsbW
MITLVKSTFLDGSFLTSFQGARTMNSQPWKHHWNISSETAPANVIAAEIRQQLHDAKWDEHEVFGVHLALEEALMNAIKHGNCFDPHKRVQVLCRLRPGRIQIKVLDQGPGFDPAAVPDCTDPERLEICSGRGLLLIRSFMTDVELVPPGNLIIMTKERSSASQVAA